MLTSFAESSSSSVAGSFRDPAGYVFKHDGGFYRAVSRYGAADYDAARNAGIFDWLQNDGLVVPILAERQVNEPKLAYILELKRLPTITYPYEWPFALLKAAAVLHLDLHIQLLERGFTLSDATAYNIQFIGPKPIFIDHLSIRPYREGEFWLGHRQFCEQFLNPLLLRAYLSLPHNGWYRGNLEGISVSEITKIIPFRRKFSWNVLTNIVLQDRFQRGTSGDTSIKLDVKDRKLPKAALVAMLRQMRKWIASLVPGDKRKTTWADYSVSNTYSDAERQAKHSFIASYARRVCPKTLIDLGCNTGEYSRRALEAGAESVVGFDFDVQALDQAYDLALEHKLKITPLFLDAMNPSPAQGWMEAERSSFSERMKADGLLALAFEHHLAIARNAPLDQVVRWLVNLAPTGVIEFVPKADRTVQHMLALREDIFPDYGIEQFEAHLKSQAIIERKEKVSESGRTLYEYRRSN